MAKFKIEWSVEARLDLFHILDYYLQQNGSPTYSIKLNKKLNKSIAHLIQHPHLGIPTDYESVRTLIVSNYQIIYELIKQTILIVMIWDLRRNPEEKKIQRRIDKT